MPYPRKFPCKHCGGTNTYTTTIASSERYIRFYCADCPRGKIKGFCVTSSKVSALSRVLRGMAQEIQSTRPVKE